LFIVNFPGARHGASRASQRSPLIKRNRAQVFMTQEIGKDWTGRLSHVRPKWGKLMGVLLAGLLLRTRSNPGSYVLFGFFGSSKAYSSGVQGGY